MNKSATPHPPSAADRQSALNAFRQAFALHQRGMLAEAERLYLDVLTVLPNMSDALHFLGTLKAQRGDYEGAVGLIGRAILINPGDASAHYNLANALRDLNRLNKAIDAYDKALKLTPAHVGALINRGQLYERLQKYDKALESYDRALAANPENANVHYNKANVLRELGRLEDALSAYTQAIALAPGNVGALNNRGNLLMRLRRNREALRDYDAALAVAPDNSGTHCNRGNVLFELRQFDQASAAYERAAALSPGLPEAHRGLGNTFFELGQYEQAFQAYDAAYRADPDRDYIEGCRLHTKMHVCDWDNLAAETASLLAHVRQGKKASEPFWLLPTPASPAEQLLCAERFSSDRHPPYPVPLWRGDKYTHGKIRVGYISGEFREQATSYLTADLFECHDRSQFEIYAFATGVDDGSVMRRRLEAAFHSFADVSEMSHRQIADLVRGSEIDVLVNLNGYFGIDRTDVFAMRPSPVQVNYLGYPGTMGAGYMDYIIADRTIIPENQQRYYSEQVVYLPDTYQPNDRKRQPSEMEFTRADLGLPENAVVFCCFNNAHKITPEMFDIWMRILRGTPESVLWLIEPNSSVRGNLTKEAARKGVSSNRLVFAPMIKQADHLGRLAFADLVLDTLPHNAHTTASDALWSGVPVLTCLGNTFPGRVAASLLKAIGLSELITGSLTNYEETALRLARDKALLAELKAKVIRNRATAPLFDTPLYAKNIEAAYKTMFQRSQAGLKPKGFSIGPK